MKTSKVLVMTITPIMPAAVLADSGEADCHDPKNARLKTAAKKTYEDMLAHDKAGRTKQAFDAAKNLVPGCASDNRQQVERMETAQLVALRRTSLKLGEQAESKTKMSK